MIMERLEDIVKKTQLNPETPPDSPLRVTVVPHCVGDQVLACFVTRGDTSGSVLTSLFHLAYSELDLFNVVQTLIYVTFFK